VLHDNLKMLYKFGMLDNKLEVNHQFLEIFPNL